MTRSSSRTDIVVAAGCGLVALVNYLATLGPTVGPGDAGELTLAALRLGIAHPPGYPLFTWLGRLAYLLPFREPAVATNSLTALIGAATVTALFFAARRLGLSVIGALVAALALGFGPAFWLVATSHEVYALTILFLCLLLLSVSPPNPENSNLSARPLLLAALLLGLALSHQPTTLLWLPALIVLAWPYRRLVTPRLTLLLAGLILLGFSASLGTLFRAPARPEVNWGNPNTLGRFLAHAFAAQYRWLSFRTPGPEFIERLRSLPADIVSSLGIVPSLVALLGLVLLAFRPSRLLLGLGLLFSTALFALGYWIPDYRFHLLPALVAVSLFAGKGATWLETRIAAIPQLGRRPNPSLTNIFTALAVLILLAIPGHTLLAYRSLTSENKTTIVRDLGENLLYSLPDSAVLLYGGDLAGNAIRYLQQVRGIRPDVQTIAVGRLLAQEYYDSLRFLAPLPDWRATLASSSATDQNSLLRTVFTALTQALLLHRPCYLTVEIVTDMFFPSPLYQSHLAVPEGIVYRLIPRQVTVNLPAVIDHSRHLWAGYRLTSLHYPFRSPDYQHIQFTYAAARNNFAMFLHEHGQTAAAIEQLHLALSLPAPPELTRLVQDNLRRLQPDRN